jgi:hypothetical protein
VGNIVETTVLVSVGIVVFSPLGRVDVVNSVVNCVKIDTPEVVLALGVAGIIASIISGVVVRSATEESTVTDNTGSMTTMDGRIVVTVLTGLLNKLDGKDEHNSHQRKNII